MVAQKKNNTINKNPNAKKLEKMKAEYESSRKLPKGKLYCTMCDTLMTENNFYESTSIVNTNGKLHICSECCNKLFDYYYRLYKKLDGDFEVNSDTIVFTVTTEKAMKSTCEKLDVPFLYAAYDSMVNHINSFKTKGKTINAIFGVYKSKLSSTCKKNGTSGLSFSDSDELKIVQELKKSNEMSYSVDFQLTDEIRNKWGYGYKPEEYEAFEKKYIFLKNDYSEVTSMHREALLNYIKYKVKEEFAIASDNVSEAEKWNKMANQASTYAKINPNQLTNADLSDGITTFSEVSMAVEKTKDIVKILPKFKYRPNDALDFVLWCYVNYDRDIRGMESVDYYDIYKFYDERVEEYKKQYGDPYDLFPDDPTVANREKIQQFLDDERKELESMGESDGE